jgi:hypothetical protein
LNETLIIYLLPKEKLKILMQSQISSSEINPKSHKLDLLFLSLKPEYHFSKFDPKKSANTFPFPAIDMKKRKDYFHTFVEVSSELFEYIRTVDVKKYPQHLSFLETHLSRIHQLLKNLSQKRKDIFIELFQQYPYEMIFKNKTLDILCSSNYGNLSFFVNNEIIPKK